MYRKGRPDTGPPWLRPAEKVREDVRQGYVTPESARSDYGVVLDPGTLDIDRDASANLRAQMEADMGGRLC